MCLLHFRRRKRQRAFHIFKGGGWMNHLFIYIVTKVFHFLISAGAAVPGCSGTANAAD